MTLDKSKTLCTLASADAKMGYYEFILIILKAAVKLKVKHAKQKDKEANKEF